MKIIASLIVSTVALAAAFGSPAAAGTLENLERERAIAIGTLLSPELSPAEREEQVALTRVRLVDLERMVMRDESLKGKNTPAVRNAFENYDLSFLAHASVERNRNMIDHWLEQIGVSTNTLMSARLGRR
jgi:hypothetical protein